MLLCKDPTPHPPNQNKTKEINVYFTYSSTNNTEGILIKIPCVNFCTHVMWDVKSTISGRRRTATDRDGSGIRDWNDLEDEQKRGASVLSLFSFSFFFFLQHPASRSGCLENKCPEKLLKIECSVEGQSIKVECNLQKTGTQWNQTESSKEVLCREWRGLGWTQSPLGHLGKLEKLVICGYQQWMTLDSVLSCQMRRKSGECSSFTTDAIQVLESVEEYAEVSSVEGSQAILEC